MKRQQRQPRNPYVVPMILGRKGGKMRDRRDRRSKDHGRSWKAEEH